MLTLCHNNYHEVCAILELHLKEIVVYLNLLGICLTRKITPKSKKNHL